MMPSNKEIALYLEDVLGSKVSKLKVTPSKLPLMGDILTLEFIHKKKAQKKYLRIASDIPLSKQANFLFDAHDSYNKIPNHLISHDVGFITQKGSLVFAGDSTSMVHLLDSFDGSTFMDTLLDIHLSGEITKKQSADIVRVIEYMIYLHNNKKVTPTGYPEYLNQSLSGDFSIFKWLQHYDNGVLDDFEIVNLVSKITMTMLEHKHKNKRSCKVHGFLLPKHIYFSNNITTINKVKPVYGEAADDVACLIMHPILLSVGKQGSFSGIQKDVFDLIWNTYFKATGDKEMRSLLPLFLATWAVYLCCPGICPDSLFGEFPNETRKILLNFANNVLNDEEFNPGKINKYLGKSF